MSTFFSPYRQLSYWMSELASDPVAGDPLLPRPALPGDLDVDVAIVGAGYTGLWTAYYLRRADPTLRIAVLEAHVAGYGASGRNGGWCSALFPKSAAGLARWYGRDRAVALRRAMVATVDEVGRVAQAEGIDCHWAKGGSLVLARSPAQLARAEREVADARAFGFGPDDLQLLTADQAAARCCATGVRGATYTPHCAAIQPARLVRGLARVVQRLGVGIYENTAVTRIVAGAATTVAGRVRAPIVVRATEGFTPGLPGLRRRLAPIYSLMVATPPLGDQFWAQSGLAQRETFADHRNLIIYGQRTADGRLAFGGRGAPYHFGSAVRAQFDRNPVVFDALGRVLVELFPSLRPVEVEWSWGGPLGVARDWCASVGLDRATGLAWAGGYVGDGVATANLAGRTLADLILDRDTELVGLPWVGHRSRGWEPEPLRWIGINAGLRVMTTADVQEARSGRAARRAAWLGRFLGG